MLEDENFNEFDSAGIIEYRMQWLDPATLGSLTACWPIHYLETGNNHPYANYIMQDVFEQLSRYSALDKEVM